MVTTNATSKRYYSFLIVFVYTVWQLVSIKEVQKEPSIDLHPKSPLISERKRKLVILFTYYRSGSTFTGQLLNQHSDVFYLFEPLILGVTENENIQSKIDVLNRIVNCSLPNFDEFSTRETPEHVKQSCQFRNFCFPHGTKEFCAPPFCKKDFTEDRKMCGHISNEYCPGPAIMRQEREHFCLAIWNTKVQLELELFKCYKFLNKSQKKSIPIRKPLICVTQRK